MNAKVWLDGNRYSLLCVIARKQERGREEEEERNERTGSALLLFFSLPLLCRLVV